MQIYSPIYTHPSYHAPLRTVRIMHVKHIPNLIRNNCSNSMRIHISN